MMFLMAMVMCFGTLMAQSEADRIVGTYKTVRNGVNSKIKVFKNNKGGYNAQVIWVDNLKKPDGSILTDEKNPDKSKRNVRADQIVLVENVTYTAKEKTWEGSKIYDPTSGKSYKVKMTFEGDKKLRVRGYLGPFYDTMHWTKE